MKDLKIGSKLAFSTDTSENVVFNKQVLMTQIMLVAMQIDIFSILLDTVKCVI